MGRGVSPYPSCSTWSSRPSFHLLLASALLAALFSAVSLSSTAVSGHLRIENGATTVA